LISRKAFKTDKFERTILLKARIGIPRGLFYYKFITLWDAFFSALGAEVIVSDPTNKHILDEGVKVCVDEACLPVKLFHGHVINLRDRVDYILIPRFTSISKGEYICPQFGGLPDMVRHSIKSLPPIIDTEINMRSSERGAITAAIQAGMILGVDKRTAKAALVTAMGKYREFRCMCMSGAVQFGMAGKPAAERLAAENRNSGLHIAVIGHPYNIFDTFISMDMLGKLESFGAETITIEMVEEKEINKLAGQIRKPFFWNYGRNAYGAAIYLASSEKIDGIISVSSFGCGIDAFVNDLIERKVRKEYEIPFISITIDEHSGEAGFNTRLEAFIDMLNWRRLNENNISASR